MLLSSSLIFHPKIRTKTIFVNSQLFLTLPYFLSSNLHTKLSKNSVTCHMLSVICPFSHSFHPSFPPSTIGVNVTLHLFHSLTLYKMPLSTSHSLTATATVYLSALTHSILNAFIFCPLYTITY